MSAPAPLTPAEPPPGVVRAPAPAAFDFGPLARPDRRWLCRAAAEVRARLGRAGRELVAAGVLLLRARRRLGGVRFRRWAEAEVGVSRRTVSRLVAVGRAFSAADPAAVARIAPTALYLLAEPGVSGPLRESVLGLAAGGTRVTPAAAREMLAAAREQTAEPSRAEVVALAPLSRAAAPEVDAEEVAAGANWALLDAMLAPGVSLHLSRDADEENGETTVSATLLGPAGRRSAVHRTLGAVVLGLSGVDRAKRCAGKCGQLKPLTKFSRRKDQPDGRNRYCLECERQRVKAADARKRAARPAPPG